MRPNISYPYNLQVEHIGKSTDIKPDKANKWAIYYELDTDKNFYWNGTDWVEVEQSVDVSISAGSVIESHLLKMLLHQSDISDQILRELKMMNLHFQSITDEKINEEDLGL